MATAMDMVTGTVTATATNRATNSNEKREAHPGFSFLNFRPNLNSHRNVESFYTMCKSAHRNVVKASRNQSTICKKTWYFIKSIL